MSTLTLARYILEMSLMHYELVGLPESLKGAAAYMLALRMKANSEWVSNGCFSCLNSYVTFFFQTDLHVQYSGYTAQELEPIMWDLNTVIKGTPLTKNLKNVRAKYSHE